MDTDGLATLGMSAARLEQVSSWLTQQASMERVAGASLMIGRRGEIAFRKRSASSTSRLASLLVRIPSSEYSR